MSDSYTKANFGTMQQAQADFSLAYRALTLEPSIGLLLPCNVVVRAVAPERTVVEAIDPQVMVQVGHEPRLAEVATEARTRLTAALDALVTRDA